MAEIKAEDKMHPTLAATEEAQASVGTLATVIVPIGQFLCPTLPTANSGSVNLSMRQHPVSHSDDYGSRTKRKVHSREISPAKNVSASTAPEIDEPTDRSEWKKTEWVSLAQSYGLSGSGNMDTVIERIQSYEAQRDLINESNRQQLEVMAAESEIEIEEGMDDDALKLALINSI